eukprot:CAMPEP_0196578858 /NCGR_PEP_ID=MMETSP1081-20130531/11564_1 /TAXON_ID=36882 /ORGANISM="Pyramimonas amylifera, Strain CCMP720" /LENGTH=120 /DNA_ID=CAMNT_0041898231 /DNA_START=426 /DNA_END=788 /DNA_ORIENTATION=+
MDLINPAAPGEPPRSYTSLCKELVVALRESVMLEASGAPEFKVRAKADVAKDKIQKFITTWRGNAEVKNEASYESITDAILTLGQFYQKNGQRKRLPQDVLDKVLDDLDAAGKSLGTFRE